MSAKIRLKLLPGDYAVAQLPHSAPIPSWADGDGFVSISRTDDELSVVCRQERIPTHVKSDDDWVCFKFVGPFEFGESGIILSVIRPLSEDGMGVFVVATFDGDVLLLKANDVPRAKTLLRDAGHRIE